MNNQDIITQRANRFLLALGGVSLTAFVAMWLAALGLYWTGFLPRLLLYLQGAQYIAFPVGMACLIFVSGMTNPWRNRRGILGWSSKLMPYFAAAGLPFAVLFGVRVFQKLVEIQQPLNPFSQGAMTWAGILVPIVALSAWLMRSIDYSRIKSSRRRFPMDDDPNRSIVD